MIAVWKTRILLWKKQIILLLFWLLLPIIGTISIISIAEMIKDETKVPVGIVLEDNTSFARELYEAIEKSPLIRIVDVSNIEARQMVSSHQLDSAFIIKEGFEEEIRKGNRNWIIQSYSTNLSFAYVPVKEMIISHVQKASGKAKTAYTVQELSKDSDQNWSWDEIVLTTSEIEQQEDLLHTEFSFHTNKNVTEKNETTLWNTWALYSTLSLISTLFLFDWVIKERNHSLTVRLPFMKIALRNYFLYNVMNYGILLFIFDLVATYLFQFFFHEPINQSFIYHLLMFRSIVVIGAFLLSQLFMNTYFYYCISMIISLVLAITSGGFIPIEGMNLLNKLGDFHPFYSFIEQEGFHLWLIPLLLLLFVWWMKGGMRTHARSARTK